MAAGKPNGAVEKVEIPQPQPKIEIKPNIIPPVDIELDPEHPEVRYRLRMTNRATRLILEATGINIWNGLGAIENLTAEHLCIIVCNCLKWEHRDLKIEDVEELPGMDAANFFYVISRLDRMFEMNMPVPDPNAKPDPNESPSVGSNTGQLAELTSV